MKKKKIQVMVDSEIYEHIKKRAKEMDYSVSLAAMLMLRDVMKKDRQLKKMVEV